MANLQLQDLQNEVFQQTGLDSTNSTIQANVTRWLNYTQQDICARWPWPFLYSRENLVTVGDYITGTVSVNTGATTVTGAGTAWTSTQADGTYYLQFSTANDWYNVTGINTGPQTLTIEKGYAQPTNGTALTYTLRKFFYSLSSAVDEIIDIRNWNTPVKLIQVDMRFIDDLNPLVQSTNAPYAYMMFGTDSSGNLRFSPYPFPSDTRLFEFRTKIRPTDMVNATDLPTLPNKFAHILAWGAIALGFAYRQNSGMAGGWSKKFEDRLTQIKSEYRQTEDWQPILKSIDSVQRSKWIQMPEQYPVITGG